MSRIAILVIIIFLAMAHYAACMDLGERLELEKILSEVMTTNSNTENIIIRSPSHPDAANEIITRSLWIASWHNDWDIRHDTPKDKDGSLIYPLKVRKELVDQEICRNFGYDAKSSPNLSGKGREDFDGKFYSLGAGDGGVTARIMKTRVLENGLLKVKGEYTFGEGDEGEFTAFFIPTDCNGYKHWGLRKIIYDDFQEEKINSFRSN